MAVALESEFAKLAEQRAEMKSELEKSRSEVDVLQSQLSAARSDAAVREAGQARQLAAARSEVTSAYEGAAASMMELAAMSHKLASACSDAALGCSPRGDVSSSSTVHSHEAAAACEAALAAPQAQPLLASRSMAPASHEAGATCEVEQSSQLEVGTAADEARGSDVHVPSSSEESGEAGDVRLAPHVVALTQLVGASSLVGASPLLLEDARSAAALEMGGGDGPPHFLAPVHGAREFVGSLQIMRTLVMVAG
ncbi:hypothetical protein FOA52_014842 [Chlamydomonas sp. UWO 241]|nr:hypothetical protein FOA52_014842 [Chlamydomonas sp. UWO 241]